MTRISGDSDKKDLISSYVDVRGSATSNTRPSGIHKEKGLQGNSGLKRTLNIGWKVSHLSNGIASIRYRAILPILSLSDKHYRSRMFSSASCARLEELDVLVIVKSFTQDDLALACEAHDRGIRVIFDLCDNIFIENYIGKSKFRPSSIFLAISSYIDAAVVSTHPLADVVKRNIPRHISVHVIPDGIETEEIIKEGEKLVKKFTGNESAFQALRRYAIFRKSCNGLRFYKPVSFGGLMESVSRKIRDHNGSVSLIKSLLMHVGHIGKNHVKSYYSVIREFRIGLNKKRLQKEIKNTCKRRILWFGNHGARHASFGMLDILEIRDALEAIAAEFPVELVVVSNNREKYFKYIKPLKIESHYIEWSIDNLEEQLRSADVVIIPNTRDPFSLCKSANRTVLALHRGVPVVATRTPALEPLSECIILDDFIGGLRCYLTNPDRVRRDVEFGREIITKYFGQKLIAKSWSEVINSVISDHASASKGPADLILPMHLIQDLDLALPIITSAHSCGINVEVWCSLSLINKSARVRNFLHAGKVPWRAIPDNLDGLRPEAFPGTARAVLTMAESNLGPHRFAHKLTIMAQKLGIATATLQHGLENIGLTYSDDVHPIKHINIASERIYIWGSVDSLHPDIPWETRCKCVPVGCPKPAVPKTNQSEALPLPEGEVIGIFENLHWHRYSDEYRGFFVEGIRHAAKCFPQIIFLVKPHHAGAWLSKNFDGDLTSSLDNVIIADPLNPIWEPYTATQLLSCVSAVITTPSTVALDSARFGLPTAVVSHSMNLERYVPLFHIASIKDWVGFVKDVKERSHCDDHIDAAKKFVNRYIVPGDAALKIVNDLVFEKSQS